MKPITLVLAKDLVTEKLREAIYTGVLKPGEELIQAKISEQLGVSRMPVREAFAILEWAGMVKAMPNKRVVVKRITPEMIEEDLELRTILECLAVQKAVQRAEDLSELAELNVKMQQCLESDAPTVFKDLNCRFHSKIWELAESPRLVQMLKQLWFAMASYYPLNTVENLRRNIREHSLILEALQNRDAKLASQAMREHISKTRQMIVKRYNEQQLSREKRA